MLRVFDSWDDLVAHVRAGGPIWYVPTPDEGPRPAIARIRHTAEAEPVRIWLRSPDGNRLNPFPSTIADESFMGKLYRWSAAKTAPR